MQSALHSSTIVIWLKKETFEAYVHALWFQNLVLRDIFSRSAVELDKTAQVASNQRLQMVPSTTHARRWLAEHKVCCFTCHLYLASFWYFPLLQYSKIQTQGLDDWLHLGHLKLTKSYYEDKDVLFLRVYFVWELLWTTSSCFLAYQKNTWCTYVHPLPLCFPST